MGRRLSKASRRHGLSSNHGSFVWWEQEFRSIPWFRSNSEEYATNQKEVPVKKFLWKKQESQGIQRNPGRNEKQTETGKCNLGPPCVKHLNPPSGNRDGARNTYVSRVSRGKHHHWLVTPDVMQKRNHDGWPNLNLIILLYFLCPWKGALCLFNTRLRGAQHTDTIRSE